MDESDFFTVKLASDEAKIKALEEIKRMNVPAGKYADADAFKFTTGINKFDFETNKTDLINNLDWLTHLSVEEFTFRKKWEEIKLLPDYIREFYNQAKAKIWRPFDLNNEELTIKEINELQPRMILAKGDEQEKLWTTLRYYCSSAEYNQAPGRFFKFFMVDINSGQILGITSIASDVIAISDRDKYIGWTSEDKLKYRMLKHSAIGTTIVPTQPFGTNFLGGKLTACLVTSDSIRNIWESKSGEGTPCKLVGMTTTSLYGNSKSNFSMYNGLKWWKPVGLSKGKIPIKPYEEVYELWHKYLKENKDTRDLYIKSMTQKEGVRGPVTGAKMRVLSMIFNVCNIKQSNYCHGYARGIYYSCFYENTREFLCRKISEDKLIIKPLFKENVEGILKWWKPRAIERYKKLKSENRLNSKILFYNEMYNMTYEEARIKFFDAVGK